MKTQYRSEAQRAPRLIVLLAGSLGLFWFLHMENGDTSRGVVSAGTTHALTTTFSSDTSRSGQMFDVHSSETIRVDDLSCNLDSPANTLVQYRIYTKIGTYEIKTHHAWLWDLQAEGNVLSTGNDVPTLLGANLDLLLPEGQITAFYVTLTSGRMGSTSSPTQYSIAASNSDLAIVEGIGISYPFGAIQQRQIWNGTIHYAKVAGTAFCFGDLQGSPCPCGNSTHFQTGCQNGSGRGARLDSCGSQSIASADLEFTVIDLPPERPVLLFSGTTKLNGGLGVFYGDGLVCIGGSLRHHGVLGSSPTGTARWNKSAISQVGYLAGQTRYFQAVFRDINPGGPCGTLINLSNGFAVTFKP